MKINADIIKNYIKLISHETGCTIIIYDDYHLLTNSGEFDNLPELCRWHTNEYCMKIKESEYLHRYCLCVNHKFKEKLKECDGIYSGSCHCGVGEFAVGIKIADTQVCVVSAAGFLGELSPKMRKILSGRVHLSETELENIRHGTLMRADDALKAKISTYLETLACLIRTYLLDKMQALPEGENKYTDAAMDYIAKAIEYIERNFSSDIKADDVARACNLSLSHLQHIFIEKTGSGVGVRIRKCRLEYACQLLKFTDRSIKSIALQSGYKNVDYFSFAFHKEFGETPLKYRKKELLK